MLTQQLTTAVARLDTARSAEEITEARALFQRISIGNPDDWAACYYIAYTDILLFFRSDDVAAKQQLLDEAAARLDKLKKMKGLSTAVRSEVNTLAGFRYYALMSLDPQANGPKYTPYAISSYAEALKQNPDNPRAILLNAYLQRSLAAFMGGAYQAFDSDKEKARILHSQEDASSFMPHWWLEI